MALWLVRAGRHGEQEALALDNDIAVIGWSDLPDLAPVKTREELEVLCRNTYPNDKPNTVTNWVGQIWAFRERIQVGDLVVLPFKSRSAVSVGRVAGPYQYRMDLGEDTHHTRPVQWLRTDLPRSTFEQDLLYSFGAFMTVCQIQRNNAEERVRAILQGQSPGDTEERAPEEIANLEEYARDQLRDYIARKFRGHELARLVNEILKAQGYQTALAPAGPDRGVDVIAGRGPMGFDRPRLCVQVKSSDSPVDVGVLRELQGVMKNFGAEQGLLVSWGGFKNSVISEARRLFFEIRLWDTGDLVRALIENYDQLSEEMRAEIPLKCFWALVLEA